MFFVMLFLFIIVIKSLQIMAPALVLVFTAFFLALALNAPVQKIAQILPGDKRGNRSLATTISVVIIFVLLGGFLASIIPAFTRQISGLIDAAPAFVADIRDENSEIGQLIDRYNLHSQVESFTRDLQDRAQDASRTFISVLGGIASSTFAVLTIVVLTFMMLIEGPRWLRIFEQLVPDDNREHVRGLARAMYKVVKGYVNGQVTLAGIAALLITPVLFLLGVSYPIALTVIVFICGLIPMVGHLIGAAIVTAVALFTSPWAAAIVLAYYFLYQQIENYWIQPKVQSNSTNMSPLLVFLAVVLGVNFGGLLGGLVAIPVVGCIRIIVLDQLTRRNMLDAPAARRAEATVNDAKSHPKKA
jgi:predicted PurR-regulated permease PerM